MACDVCSISMVVGKKLTQVVWSHLPKFTFFQTVARTFQLGFKRPAVWTVQFITRSDRVVAGHGTARRGVRHWRSALQPSWDSCKTYTILELLPFVTLSLIYNIQQNAVVGPGSSLARYAYDTEVEFGYHSIDIHGCWIWIEDTLLSSWVCLFFARSCLSQTCITLPTTTPSTRSKPYHTYLWNNTSGGKGPEEMCSILLQFIVKHRTGVKRLAIECDGCSGQLWCQYFFAICAALWDPTSDLCRKLGVTPGRSVFERIDVFRGEVGHTFMSCDRVHGVVCRSARARQSVASIDEYAQIVRRCDQGRFNVTLIKPGDGFFLWIWRATWSSHSNWEDRRWTSTATR